MIAAVLILPQFAAVSARTLVVNIATDEATENWSQSRREAYSQLIRGGIPAPIGHLRLGDDPARIPIFSGTRETSLTLGAGHLSDTAPLNGAGNAAIAGHRDGFFRSLSDVEVGDVLHVETTQAARRYRVTHLWIVEPTDLWVLDDTASNSITLITCHPFYFVGHAPDRFIVRAEAVSGKPTETASTPSTHNHQPTSRRPT